MQRGSASDALTLRHAIENGSTEQLDAIVEIVRNTGALEIARQAAASEAHRAIAAAKQLPTNEYSAGLLQLAAQLLERRT
jgi:octaprenyl-diphosphate synthase